MERIFKIIFDASINYRILNINDLSIIIDEIVGIKSLNNYVLNIDDNQIGSNKLASYLELERMILINSKVIDKMIKELHKNNKVLKGFEEILYFNLRIAQVVLHEIEHANQKKMINNNSLESFILRISEIVPEKKQIYEYIPKERFAEIKSYAEIILMTNYHENNNLNELLQIEKLQRLMRGYHYKESSIISPIESYFEIGERKDLLYSFDWYSNSREERIKKVKELYSLDDSLFYGFNISDDDYKTNMINVVNGTNHYFNNKIKILK